MNSFSFEKMTDVKATLLALMFADGLQKELECNSELLARLQLMVVERLCEREVTPRTTDPVEYCKENLFPASVGPWNDGGLQMIDLLFCARKCFVAFCSRAWEQDHGWPTYPPQMGIVGYRLRRAEARFEVMNILLSLEDCEYVAKHFRPDRRLMNADAIKTNHELSHIYCAQRVLDLAPCSEASLSAAEVAAHKATLGGAWTDTITGNTLKEAFDARCEEMQRAMLPTEEWREKGCAMTRCIIQAMAVHKGWPRWWPTAADPKPHPMQLAPHGYAHALLAYRAAMHVVNAHLEVVLQLRQKDKSKDASWQLE